jgi:hypothetical protein
MRAFHKMTLGFVDGLGITQPSNKKKQSTELLLGGLLLVLVLGGLAL